MAASSALHGNVGTVSGAVTTNTTNITANDADIATVSGALNTTSGALKANIATVSAALLTKYSESSGARLYSSYQVTSGAFNVNEASLAKTYVNYQITSGAFNTNEASLAKTYTNYQITSSAYITHSADTSDPHGSTITQTNLKLTSGSIQSDHTALSGAMIRNFVFGTGSTPPTASNFTQGTIYLQYTP